MFISIDNLHAIGNITDVPAWSLPPNAVTYTNNVHFDDGAVRKSAGYTYEYVAPDMQTWMVNYNDFTRQRLMIITDGPKMFDYDPAGNTIEITPLVPVAEPVVTWSSVAYSDHVIITNNANEPQYYHDSNAGPVFVPLSSIQPTWPDTWVCKQMGLFDNVLVAMNMVKDTQEIPNLVQWSDVLAEDEAPPSWDETDPATLAGSNLVGASESGIVGGLQLRNAFIIYTSTSAHSMTRTNDTVYVYAFKKLFSHGMLSTNAVVQFNIFHFVVGDGVLYAHDGNRVTYVADHKVNEKFFFELANPDKLSVTNDHKRGYIYIAYSDNPADDWSNRVLIWNYRDDTWSFQDMNDERLVRGVFAPVATASTALDTWADVDPSLLWDNIALPWSKTAPSAAESWLQYATRSTNVLRLVAAFLRNNKEYVAEARRDYIDLTSLINDGGSGIRHLKQVIPKIEGSGSVWISIGYSMGTGIAMTWLPEVNYNISDDYKVDARCSGRYLGWRIRSDGPGFWRMTGIGLDIEDASRR